MADRLARAAARPAADHWFFRLRRPSDHGALGCNLRAAAGRAWLDRESKRLHRVPLGGGAQRTTELARLKVDVIVTGGTPTAAATKAVTAGIPIVFTLA